MTGRTVAHATDGHAGVIMGFGRVLGRWWRWLVGQVIEDTPADILVCENICRELDCDGWSRCERRLRYGRRGRRQSQ